MGNIFHILNRGVDKRKIFNGDKDYLRFAHNLFDFNTTENVILSYYRRRANLSDVRRPTEEELVDVVCWCLLPNHVHILAAEKFPGAASIFSKKIFGGYTKYFNEQNKRSGVLFQGRSKIILVKREGHFLYLPFYIHLNPLDLFQSDWKEAGVKNTKRAMEFLEDYRWSSFFELNKRNDLSSIMNKKLFFEITDTNPKKHKKDLENWLEACKDDITGELNGLVIE